MYVKIWGPQDQEILVNMSIKAPEIVPDETYFKEWMESRIPWGKTFLLCAGIITATSIITMIIKHI